MITIATIWMALLTLLVLFLAHSVRKAHRAIKCPIRGTDASVQFLESLPEGRPIDVTACSEFTPPSAVTCDQRCLACLTQRAMPPAGV